MKTWWAARTNDVFVSEHLCVPGHSQSDWTNQNRHFLQCARYCCPTIPCCCFETGPDEHVSRHPWSSVMLGARTVFPGFRLTVLQWWCHGEVQCDGVRSPPDPPQTWCHCPAWEDTTPADAINSHNVTRLHLKSRHEHFFYQFYLVINTRPCFSVTMGTDPRFHFKMHSKEHLKLICVKFLVLLIFVNSVSCLSHKLRTKSCGSGLILSFSSL